MSATTHTVSFVLKDFTVFKEYKVPNSAVTSSPNMEYEDWRSALFWFEAHARINGSRLECREGYLEVGLVVTQIDM